MTFDKKINLLLREFTNFVDLPKSIPYGFWVSPDGEYEIVKEYKHLEVAGQLVRKYPEKFRIKYSIQKYRGNYDEFLLINGWVRIVTGGYATGKLYAQHSIAGDEIPLTRKAKSSITDLAFFYNISENDIEYC